MGKKRIRKKKYSAKKNRSTGILPILFIVALLALFSETVRTIPVRAFSDNFSYITYEVPRLNSALLEDKFIKNNNKIKYKATKEEIIIKTKFPNELETVDSTCASFTNVKGASEINLSSVSTTVPDTVNGWLNIIEKLYISDVKSRSSIEKISDS